MSGSIFGKNFSISTWGESHGEGLGVVVDGCPAGIALDASDIQADMDRRKPGNNPFATKRVEDDEVLILSGVFEGLTTGTPISLVVYNKGQRSKDYSEISKIFRPGHADFTYEQKFGVRDYRGGGRSSGRETLARVAGGAIAKKILSSIGVEIQTYTYSIGDIVIDKDKFSYDEIFNNHIVMPDKDAAQKAAILVEKCMKNKDSVGGVVQCVVKNMPIGIGEPCFDKLDANLAKAIFSIGAVKGFEIGSGFLAANSFGSDNNDEFLTDKNGEITKKTNNAGGILGGISDGSDIIFRAAFKPTPSISKTQETVDCDKQAISINVKGRHDPIIVPRAVIVVEAMAAITLVDMLFGAMFSNITNVKKVFGKD